MSHTCCGLRRPLNRCDGRPCNEHARRLALHSAALTNDRSQVTSRSRAVDRKCARLCLETAHGSGAIAAASNRESVRRMCRSQRESRGVDKPGPTNRPAVGSRRDTAKPRTRQLPAEERAECSREGTEIYPPVQEATLRDAKR